MTRQEQRRAGIAARRAIGPAARAAYNAAICAHIEGSAVFQNAKMLLTYRAMPEEADLSALAMHGKTAAYPRCTGPGLMEARVPIGGAFIRGAFGIWEPDPARSELLAPEDIELVLVPCSAFDLSGGRAGMGGGYYDRFLPACKHAVKLLVAYEAQRAEAVVLDAHDVRMDAAVTEKAFYEFRSN